MFNIVLNLLLQLSLAALALGAPIAQDVSATTAGNSWQYGTGGGIIGFIVLVLDIIVFSTPTPPPHLLLIPPSTGIDMLTDLFFFFFVCNSRGPEVQPPTSSQAALVLGCLPLPHCRNGYLLALFQPC